MKKIYGFFILLGLAGNGQGQSLNLLELAQLKEGVWYHTLGNLSTGSGNIFFVKQKEMGICEPAFESEFVVVNAAMIQMSQQDSFFIWSDVCDPYPRTLVYRVNGTELKLEMDEPLALIVKAEMAADTLEFITYSEGVGCITGNHLDWHVLSSSGAKTTRTLYWGSESYFPLNGKPIQSGIPTEIPVADKLIIRNSPEINDSLLPHPCTDEMQIRGNWLEEILVKRIESIREYATRGEWKWVIVWTRNQNQSGLQRGYAGWIKTN